MDFDDIILLTVKLLQQNPDVLDYYQEKFRYVLIDEYQGEIDEKKSALS